MLGSQTASTGNARPVASGNGKDGATETWEIVLTRTIPIF